MRVGVVGCGAIARRVHLPALQAAGAEVVAVTSATRSSAEAAAAECGGALVVDDWRALVERTDLEAVDVCTPNSLHAPIAVAAARAGKHVLVEKPMATTVADCDAMIAAAAAGVVLMPAHNARFAPPFVAAADVVAAGEIGAVHGFRAALGHAGPEAWAPGSTWFRNPALSGGGALIDLGVHMIDVLRTVLRDEVVEVSAVLAGPDGDVEDDAHVLLRFAGGAIGSLHASWASRSGRDQQLTLAGRDGSLHLDRSTPLTLRRAGGDPVEAVALPAAVTDIYAAFVTSAASGSPPPVTTADGRAAVAVVEAAYRSARDGRAVSLQ